jgi:hypothetical protein
MVGPSSKGKLEIRSENSFGKLVNRQLGRRGLPVMTRSRAHWKQQGTPETAGPHGSSNSATAHLCMRRKATGKGAASRGLAHTPNSASCSRTRTPTRPPGTRASLVRLIPKTPYTPFSAYRPDPWRLPPNHPSWELGPRDPEPPGGSSPQGHPSVRPTSPSPTNRPAPPVAAEHDGNVVPGAERAYDGCRAGTTISR